MTTQSRDIVERLEEWKAFYMGHENVNPSGTIQEALVEAITTIKFLRKAAGAVSDGPSFAEIIEDMPRRSTEPDDPK